MHRRRRRRRIGTLIVEPEAKEEEEEVACVTRTIETKLTCQDDLSIGKHEGRPHRIGEDTVDRQGVGCQACRTLRQPVDVSRVEPRNSSPSTMPSSCGTMTMRTSSLKQLCRAHLWCKSTRARRSWPMERSMTSAILPQREGTECPA